MNRWYDHLDTTSSPRWAIRHKCRDIVVPSSHLNSYSCNREEINLAPLVQWHHSYQTCNRCLTMFWIEWSVPFYNMAPFAHCHQWPFRQSAKKGFKLSLLNIFADMWTTVKNMLVIIFLSLFCFEHRQPSPTWLIHTALTKHSNITCSILSGTPHFVKTDKYAYLHFYTSCKIHFWF